jgi:hypothetical protein
VSPKLPRPGTALAAVGRFAGFALTFLCVVIAWIFFRSTSFDGAARLLSAMFLIDTPPCGSSCLDNAFAGLSIPPTSPGYLVSFFAVGFAIVWLLPTTQDSVRRLEEVADSAAWVAAGALIFMISSLAVINASHQISEFIYFNF